MDALVKERDDVYEKYKMLDRMVLQLKSAELVKSNRSKGIAPLKYVEGTKIHVQWLTLSRVCGPFFKEDKYKKGDSMIGLNDDNECTFGVVPCDCGNNHHELKFEWSENDAGYIVCGMVYSGHLVTLTNI